MSDQITLPLTPAQVLARLSGLSAEVAQGVVAVAPGLQRTVGLQILLARTPTQVARILPRSASAAENTALFHFGN